MTTFADAATVSSPRDVYLAACAANRVRVNTGVLKTLSEVDFAKVSKLDFSRNCLGQKGLNPILPVIERCTALREFSAADNYLSNESVVMLCDALTTLPGLESLVLARNPISYPSGKRIEQLVMNKPSLSTVDLNSTLMNPALAAKVMVAASSRFRGDEGDAVGSASIRRPAQLTAADLQVAGSGSVAPSTTCLSGAGPSTFDGVSPRPSGDVDDDAAASATYRQHRERAAQASVVSTSRSSATAETPVSWSKMPATRAVRPDDPWYAMETVWSIAADSAPQADGGRTFHGLLCLMAQMRGREEAIANLAQAAPATAA